MNKEKWINIILFSLFIVGLLITMYIIFIDLNTPYAFRFVVGFVIFMMLYALFQVLLIIMNMRKMKSGTFRKRILKFIGAFAFLMALSWVLNYFFWPEDLGNWDFGVPLGLATAFAFYDLMFIHKKN